MQLKLHLNSEIVSAAKTSNTHTRTHTNTYTQSFLPTKPEYFHFNTSKNILDKPTLNVTTFADDGEILLKMIFFCKCLPYYLPGFYLLWIKSFAEQDSLNKEIK